MLGLPAPLEPARVAGGLSRTPVAGRRASSSAAPSGPVFDNGAGGIAARGYLFIAFLACNTM